MKCQNNKGGKTQNMSTTEKQSEEVEAPQRFHNHLVTTENLLPVCNLFLFIQNKLLKKGHTV